MRPLEMAVCMKAVPSTTEVRMDPKTNTIVRDGRQSVLNPFDCAALEVALGLRERFGGHVVVVSMGIPDTERLLRDAVARGADEGVLLSDRAFAGADTLATSYTLSLALARLAAERGVPAGEGPGFDLVLCGKMAVDGDTAQIGPELSGLLGVPCVTDVRAVAGPARWRDGGDALDLRHGTDGGEELARCALPAVLTFAKDAAALRMPSIEGVRRGVAGRVRVWGAADVDADRGRIGLAGSPTQVVRSFVPERASEAVAVEGTPREQAAALARIFGEAAR